MLGRRPRRIKAPWIPAKREIMAPRMGARAIGQGEDQECLPAGIALVEGWDEGEGDA